MRRAFSIFLILFFGLGPLTATLDASGDARLPACCRRNGAHQCAMSDALMARMVQAASGQSFFTAPSHCPFYPCGDSANVASMHALASAATSLPGATEESNTLSAYRAATSANQIRTHAGRGPPRIAIG